MIGQPAVNPAEIDRKYEKLKEEADATGYYLNPDAAFVRELASGLLVNESRYGYPSCPCRLASGIKAEDRDIICPCDYRDADLTAYGTCYCGLYVSQKAAEGLKTINSIPERRLPPVVKAKPKARKAATGIAAPPLPVWRCRVCGYLCAREAPPEICPICKAKKERFERFL